MVSLGANINGCFSRDDPRSVLYFLLKNHQSKLAHWLLEKGASPACLLRWKFMVVDRVMTPMEVLSLFDTHQIDLSLKSDDGFNYNLMDYMCYFGLIEGVKTLAECPVSQSLINDPTESNDIALTIALLSPETTVDTKEEIASILCESSNITICNKSSQNPIQLALLLGKIDLLFRMLPYATNVRYDGYGNSYLHLAIKAGLPTVARFILHYTNVADINKKDCAGDTVLTLALKSGDEELACEILNSSDAVNPSLACSDWQMEGCEKDLAIHQALKRNMQYLANAICESGDFFLSRDTQGELPIHLALSHHLPLCIDYMLSRDDVSSFINAPNGEALDSPLHVAIKLGYYEQSLRILYRGGDVNCVNRAGMTVVHTLVKSAMNEYATVAAQVLSQDQYLQLLQEILKHQPDVKTLCKDTSENPCETALHMAIRGGMLTEKLALMLLQYDPDLVMIRDYENCTPMIRAVEMRSLCLVKALCANHAELHIVNRERNSPLHIAVTNRDTEIVRFLVSHGAFYRVWNSEGYYPIHIAIKNNDLESLMLLCMNEIDANLVTRGGESCFLLACASGAYSCVPYLLDHGSDPYLLNRKDQSCISVVTEIIQSNPTSGDYYSIAYLMCELIEVFTRECFPHTDQLERERSLLASYVEKGVSSGEFHPESVTVILHDMACAVTDEPELSVVYPVVQEPQLIPLNPRESFMNLMTPSPVQSPVQSPSRPPKLPPPTPQSQSPPLSPSQSTSRSKSPSRPPPLPPTQPPSLHSTLTSTMNMSKIREEQEYMYRDLMNID